LEFKKLRFNKLFLIAFGNKIDLNILSAFRYILYKIHQIIDFKRLQHYSTLTPKEEEMIIRIIQSELESIYC